MSDNPKALTAQEFIDQFAGMIAIGGHSSGLFAADAMMRLKYGTAALCAAYVGKLNEVVYCPDDKMFHFHDGVTPGGVVHLKMTAG